MATMTTRLRNQTEEIHHNRSQPHQPLRGQALQPDQPLRGQVLQSQAFNQLRFRIVTTSDIFVAPQHLKRKTFAETTEPATSQTTSVSTSSPTTTTTSGTSPTNPPTTSTTEKETTSLATTTDQPTTLPVVSKNDF